MKATDNALDDGKDAIRLLKGTVTLLRVFPLLLNTLLAGPVPLKPAPRNKWAGGSLFLDGGDQDAATEYPTLLEKQAVDDISSTLSVSSRTKKRKLNSSEEASRFSIPPRSQADCLLLSLLPKSLVEYMTAKHPFLRDGGLTRLRTTASPAYLVTNQGDHS